MKVITTFTPRFIPDSNTYIYHYCNERVLKSICSNKEIWLSDIYSMNDSTEFEYGRGVFINVLKEYKNEFSQEFRFYMISKVMSTIPNTLPLIACFSRQGDLLSQWRAYADDGSGFSIGFSSRSIMEEVGVNINSVVYDEVEQHKMVLDTIRGLFAMWEINNRNYDEINNPASIFAIDLAYLKNSTFFEEQEVRIIRLLVKEGQEFIDIGGNNTISNVKQLNVLTRIKNAAIIKYIKLPIKIADTSIIREVIIGPKNRISIKEVENILLDVGLDDLLIRKSKSTYR